MSASAGSGRATGKAILVGEHFVLDGLPALAMPLPGFETRVRWRLNDTPLAIESDQPLADAARADAERMVRTAAELAGVRAQGELQVRSSIPLHRGFGSSAAFAVATLRAAEAASGAALHDLLGAARQVEAVVHGSSSGLDPATAMGQGAVRFAAGEVTGRLVPADTPALRQARWVLTDVGQAPSTGEAIARANAARARMPAAELAALLARVARATETTWRGLERGDPGVVADGMAEAGACLERIDVVDERMRAAFARALAAGALAAKQSGAGLGGAVLALAPNAEIAEIIAERQRAAGLPTWTLEIAP